MKLKLYIFILLAGISGSAVAQLASIQTSIKTCNSKALAEHFTSNIELSILDKEDVFSKTQAEMIIKSFFEKKICKSFEVIHTGKAKGESKYVIGELTTSESSYRVYFVNKDGKIIEFSIEEE